LLSPLLLDGCRSKVVTKHIGLSCFQITPANRRCLLQRQPKSIASIKFTPTASIGINTDTPGIRSLIHVSKSLPGTHPFRRIHRLSSIVHYWEHIPSRCFGSFVLLLVLLHSVHSNHSFPPLLLHLFLLSFVLLVWTLNSRSAPRIFHAVQPAMALWYLLVVFFLTKQSSNSNFTPAVSSFRWVFFIP
jgi:hypothetical protein